MKLGDFLKNYVRNKAISQEKVKTYDDFLKSEGLDASGDRADTLAAALADYERDLPTYGATAEALSRSGLTESGYGDYLASVTEAGLLAASAEAEDAYREAENGQLQSYASYLEKEAEDRASLREKVLRAIENADVMYYDDAYSYAVTAGLGDADARAVAESAILREKRASMQDVLEKVLHHGYDQKTALRYAMASGLSAKDAARIASLAEDLRDKEDFYYDAKKGE